MEHLISWLKSDSAWTVCLCAWKNITWEKRVMQRISFFFSFSRISNISPRGYKQNNIQSLNRRLMPLELFYTTARRVHSDSEPPTNLYPREGERERKKSFIPNRRAKLFSRRTAHLRLSLWKITRNVWFLLASLPIFSHPLRACGISHLASCTYAFTSARPAREREKEDLEGTHDRNLRENRRLRVPATRSNSHNRRLAVISLL